MNLAPLSVVLLVFAVTISAVYDSILPGLLPFTLVFGNEVLRAWALRTPEVDPFAEDEA